MFKDRNCDRDLNMQCFEIAINTLLDSSNNKDVSNILFTKKDIQSAQNP
jgi:hypothetical protein